MLESCCIAQNSQDMHSEPGLVQIEADTHLRSSHRARRQTFQKHFVDLRTRSSGAGESGFAVYVSVNSVLCSRTRGITNAGRGALLQQRLNQPAAQYSDPFAPHVAPESSSQ